MARMKEIYSDLQNQYGQDLEYAPVGFSVDEYLKEVADKLEKAS